MTLFFGYVGTNFNGMQWQRETNIPTIERELIEKLHAEEYIPTKAYPELVKLFKWSRAARTDKGVHAVLNGVSFLISLKSDEYIEEDMLEDGGSSKRRKGIDHEKINRRLHGLFKSITVYGVKEVRKKFDIRQIVKSREYCYICPIKLFQNGLHPTSKEETISKMNRIAQSFVGTRNYHNYSSGMKAKDPSAKRYIMSVLC